MSDPGRSFELVSKSTGHFREPVFECNCVRMTGTGSGRRDPWRPVPAGRSVGKRFARPALHVGNAARAKGRAGAWTEERGGLCRATREGAGHKRRAASAEGTASPEGVMTMISEITTAGAGARNRVPDEGLFDAVPLPSRVPSAALSLLRT